MAKRKKPKTLFNCNYEAQRYCINKGIIIYPYISDAGYKISYQYGEKPKDYENGRVFDESNVFQAIWDLFDKIYQFDKKRGKI
jgi:hypothetical protein